MNIVFEFGERYYATGESSIYLSVFLTFLGAFFGFLGALLIDRKVKKRDEKKKEKESLLSKYNQLRYFRDTIESVLYLIPKQTKQYVEFSKELKTNPLEIIIPEVHATFDLMRLRNIDTKENQESFFEFFEKNNENIKLYRNSISYADYLYRIFNDSEKNITRAIDFKHKDQQVVRDCMEESSILLALRLKKLEVEGKQSETEYSFLSEIADKYSALINGFLIFKNVKNDFVYPLFTKALSTINDDDTAMKVFVLCRKANSRLNGIEANALQVANDYENFESQTSDSIAHLTKIKNEINKINEP